MTEHIVAVFPDTGTADAAERDLKNAGIPDAAIRRYANNGSHATEREPVRDRQTHQVETAQPSGFWAWLLGEETSSVTTTDAAYGEEFDRYERRAAAGDTVLSVTIADDSKIHQAVEVLDSHHPLDMDERTEEVPGDIDRGASASRGVSGQGAEEVIPLAEEQIEVGKQKVGRGTTRVRRYVVETPVEREVTLQGERVTVERRRPMTTGAPGAGAFEERVVEVQETEETPVVQKTAHVTEEVAVRREATERTEKIHDTVRREEVEITPEDTRRDQR